MYNPTTEEQATRALDNVLNNVADIITGFFGYVATHPAMLIAISIFIALIIAWLVLYVHIARVIVRVCKNIIKKYSN